MVRKGHNSYPVCISIVIASILITVAFACGVETEYTSQPTHINTESFNNNEPKGTSKFTSEGPMATPAGSLPTPTPSAVSKTYAQVKEDTAPTPIAVSTNTTSTSAVPNSEQFLRETAPRDSQDGPFPRAVQPDSLSTLCGPFDLHGSQGYIMVSHINTYEELDGQFALSDGLTIEEYFDITNIAVRSVARDMSGTKIMETRIVDDVLYYQLAHEDNDSQWVAEPEGVQDLFMMKRLRTLREQAVLPAESIEEVANQVCNQPLDTILSALDYGNEVLDGTDTRHIELSLDVSIIYAHYDVEGWVHKVEFWMDSNGDVVQSRATEIRSSSQDSEITRTKSTRLRKFSYLRSPIAIKAPDTFIMADKPDSLQPTK